jgi:hypothetical protein
MFISFRDCVDPRVIVRPGELCREHIQNRTKHLKILQRSASTPTYKIPDEHIQNRTKHLKILQRSASTLTYKIPEISVFKMT